MKADKKWLKVLYEKYNHPKWIHPDPLEFVRQHQSPLDQEVAGLIASSLAYGRVKQILSSVMLVLKAMGGSPRNFLLETDRSVWLALFKDFKHRFTSAQELVKFLEGIKKTLEHYGSLYECFAHYLEGYHFSVIPALSHFVRNLRNGDLSYNSLLPLPEKGSACKRLHLFLRWMIRRDSVDPGPWEGIAPSILVIPLDTHMYRICSNLGMTQRKSADQKCALEITDYFRNICPDDPVKYDFSLSRLGIRQEDFIMPDGSILRS